MSKKYRDAGIIVAICTVLVVLLAGVYLINNGNGRDLSGFKDTGADVNTTTSAPHYRKALGRDDSQPDDSVVSHAGRSSTPAAALFEAISKVETNHNDRLIGDGGKSLGRYQISRNYWTDGCKEIAKTLNVPLENVKPAFSYTFGVYDHRICQIIMQYYWQRFGGVTDEQKLALHVAGPTAIAKMETSKEVQKYISKVKEILSASN